MPEDLSSLGFGYVGPLKRDDRRRQTKSLRGRQSRAKHPPGRNRDRGSGSVNGVDRRSGPVGYAMLLAPNSAVYVQCYEPKVHPIPVV